MEDEDGEGGEKWKMRRGGKWKMRRGRGVEKEEKEG